MAAKEQPRKKMTTREALVAPVLFVALVCWYAMCEDGTVCSNDGSTYALTKSIAERGSLSLGDKAEMIFFDEEGIPVRYGDGSPENAEKCWMLTEGVDYAVRDGKLYTDRSPGASFLAVPFYYMGEATVRLLPPEDAPFFHTRLRVTRHRDAYIGWWPALADVYESGKKRQDIPPIDYPDYLHELVPRFYRLGQEGKPLPSQPIVSAAERTRQYFATLLSGVAAALAAALIYLSCRLMRLAVPAAAGAALVYALCTVHAKYATMLFTHSVAGFFVVLSLYLTLRIGIGGKTGLNYAALGFAMAMAFVSEYPNALFCLGFLLYLFVIDRRRRLPLSGSLPFYAMIAAGAALPLAAFGAYNYHCFGNVFTTSYGYQAHFAYNKNFAEAFREPVDAGLNLLLVNPETKGLLVASPVLLLAILGFYHFFRTWRAEAVTAGALFTVMLLIMSKKTATTGGSTEDPRYLAASMGLLVMGAGFFLDGVLRLRRWKLRRLGLALFAALFIYSAVTQYFHFLTFMTGMPSMQRLTDFGMLFPGYPRLILVLPAAALAGFIWFIVRRNAPAPEPDSPS